MRINITLSNIDKFIFYDKEAQKILPEFVDIFNKWSFGLRTAITTICKDARLEFINSLTADHIKRLEYYFKSPVNIEKIDSSLVKNYVINIDDTKSNFIDMTKFGGNFSISREGDLIYICQWR